MVKEKPELLLAGGSFSLPSSLARRRGVAREHVNGILEEIDAIVRTLI